MFLDEREINRNNAVFEEQGNRNPYVDYPGLEEYTWGDMMDTPFSYDNYNTGIEEIVKIKKLKNESIYNLQGQRVSWGRPKGIYIIDGRKVMVKN